MNPSVFIVGSIEAGPIQNMFLDEGWRIASKWREADLIQFTGGHDVSPLMYGEAPHESTWFWPNRDRFEWLMFELATKYGKSMAGICRGGQFLNVCAGGRMWQDIDGHAIIGMHPVTCHLADEKVMVSSAHHQMMKPTADAIILMTASESTYKERCDKDGMVIKVMNDDLDIEACFYKKEGALCFQPHPEYHHITGIHACRNRYFDYLDEFFGLRARKED